NDKEDQRDLQTLILTRGHTGSPLTTPSITGQQNWMSWVKSSETNRSGGGQKRGPDRVLR
ncbi:MAG: hypothetical protein VX034_01020, partial [Planctomycetota bacterium]|nr:hypothetical protein [Planctomycetota bacterium]